MTLSGFEQDRRGFVDDASEVSFLKRELDELRTREILARKEAETAQRRLSEFVAASKRFTSSMRGLADERRRSSRRLSVQYAVGRVLADSENLRDAAPRVLQVIGEGLAWDVGAAWVADEGAGLLRCLDVWRAPALSSDPDARAFEEATRGIQFPRGLGLPGRVWATGEAVQISDVSNEEGLFREDAMAAAGLRQAFAFPIRDGGRTLGVVEFFGRDAESSDGYTGEHPESNLDRDLLRTANLIGHQIGEFVERRRAEEERERLLRQEREAHAEAERSRRQVTDTLESISDAFFSLDWERRFGYVNREAEHMWGREREELFGRKVWEAFPEMVGSDSYRAIERAVKEQVMVRFEELSPALERWVSGTVYSSATGVSVYFRDVTEQKEAEEALKQSEERYRTLTANIPGAVFRADVVGGQPSMAFVSDRIEEITGYPSADFISSRVRNYREVIHAEDFPKNERDAWRALKRKEPYNIEYRIVRADGEVRWVNERGSGAFSEDGELLWVDGAIFDVTERRRTEEALRESEERFRSLIQHASDIITVLDTDATILYESPSIELVLGYSSEEMLGENALEYVHPDDVERVLEAGTAISESGGISPLVELRFRHRDGSWRHLESVGTNLLDDPMVRGIVVNSRDITERRRAESERDRSRRREREARDAAEAAQEQVAYLAGASEERRRISRELHDRVAHSIAVVHQSLQLYEVLKDRDARQADAKIEQARSLAKSALDSTRDLSMALRESEVEEGLGPALSKLLETTVPPGIRYAVSVEGEETLVPSHARDQIFLILREAVRNAAAHSAGEKIIVELDISPERAVGRVEDDGRSFDPEKAQDNGTGGLRSMRERAALAGGALNLESGPDTGGTKIEVIVPLGNPPGRGEDE